MNRDYSGKSIKLGRDAILSKCVHHWMIIDYDGICKFCGLIADYRPALMRMGYFGYKKHQGLCKTLFK